MFKRVNKWSIFVGTLIFKISLMALRCNEGVFCHYSGPKLRNNSQYGVEHVQNKIISWSSDQGSALDSSFDRQTRIFFWTHSQHDYEI